MHLTQPQFLYLIEFCVPNNRKDDSNGKEEKSRYKNTAIALLFGIFELALTVIGISLLTRSAHGNKGKKRISKRKANTNQGALAADIQHAGKKRHQYAGNKESIGQYLNIYRYAFREKAF